MATVKTFLSLLENIDFESLPSKYNVLKEHLLKDYGSLNVQASDVYNLAQKVPSLRKANQELSIVQSKLIVAAEASKLVT